MSPGCNQTACLSSRLAPQVCWAHPKFGSLLATASFDGKVIIWKEVADNVWQQVGGTCAVDLQWQPFLMGAH